MIKAKFKESHDTHNFNTFEEFLDYWKPSFISVKESYGKLRLDKFYSTEENVLKLLNLWHEYNFIKRSYQEIEKIVELTPFTELYLVELSTKRDI